MSLAAALLALVPGPLLPLLALPPPPASCPLDAREVCTKDIDFALEALQQECGQFFGPKGIDRKAVTAEFRAEARRVRDERLGKFPQDKLRYDPAKAGWKPPKK